MLKQRRQLLVSIAVIVPTFLFFLLFLTKLHPIALFESDSWYYAYHHRHPWPIWQNWNPSRVFPEVFMPLVTSFSAYVIYPITQDYFFSLTIGYALVVSAGVTLLMWMVFRHFRKQGSGPLESFAITALFLICHFLVLCSAKTDNKYMLLTDNTCTYFYYVLPNLLNCVLVLWLTDDPKLLFFFSPKYRVRKSIFAMLAYFCVFSNLWGSMISCVYAGVALLVCFIKAKKHTKHWFSRFLKKYVVLILLLVMWLFSLWFEFNGGRSSQIRTLQFAEALTNTLSLAKSVLSTVSQPFIWLSAILCVGGLGVTLWKRDWGEIELALYAVITALLVAVYLVLTCAVAAPGYITRPDTFYGLFFYAMLALLILFRQMMRHLPPIRLIVPLCLVILACECNTSNITYLNSMHYNLSAEVCYSVDNDILQQLQSAIEAGKKKTVLYVPQFDTEDNYPLALYAKNRIPTHLYKMGVLPRNIKVTEMIPTKDKNKVFRIKV